MKVVFLSLPMNGRDEKDVLADIARMKTYTENKVGEEVTIVHNFDCVGSEIDGRLYYLGEAIKKMDKADMVCFSSTWGTAKGCLVEMMVAQLYNIPYIMEPYTEV